MLTINKYTDRTLLFQMVLENACSADMMCWLVCEEGTLSPAQLC